MEVESMLYRHPRVLEAAGVAMPHPWWGESPCAFVAVKKNSAGKTDDVKEAEIISYCRKNLAHFMVPKKVEFMAELPRNHTGKILKSQLRAVAKSLAVWDNTNGPPSSDKKTSEEVATGLSQYDPEKQEQRVLSFSSSRL